MGGEFAMEGRVPSPALLKEPPGEGTRPTASWVLRLLVGGEAVGGCFTRGGTLDRGMPEVAEGK
jgi:hypothetical protein